MYTIGPWGFVQWFGQSPRLVNQHMRIFNKPGQPGVSAQLLGAFGDPFEVELHAVFVDQPSMLIAENGYRFMITAGAVNIVYNNVNYATVFSHRYLVINVTVTEQKCLPRMINALPGGYDYFAGWRMKSRWLLQPIVL